jgi:hypothetical protein
MSNDNPKFKNEAKIIISTIVEVARMLSILVFAMLVSFVVGWLVIKCKSTVNLNGNSNTITLPSLNNADDEPAHNDEIEPYNEIDKDKCQIIHHRVRETESIYSIARQYETPWRQILEFNHLSNPSEIRAGQIVKVPARPAAG